MGKHDLSMLKLKTEKKLPEINTPSLLKKTKVGRPAKPVDQCESEPLTLKLTPIEMQMLKEKAGLVPLSRYLKHYLRTTTDLFDK
jgi:hypothetical protein